MDIGERAYYEHEHAGLAMWSDNIEDRISGLDALKQIYLLYGNTVTRSPINAIMLAAVSDDPLLRLEAYMAMRVFWPEVPRDFFSMCMHRETHPACRGYCYVAFFPLIFYELGEAIGVLPVYEDGDCQ